MPVRVDTLTQYSKVEAAEYEALKLVEMPRAAALRAHFKQGRHAKTAEGTTGVVLMDTGFFGGGHYTNKTQLRLADGTRTNPIKVDTLTECSEAEHKAVELVEMHRFEALHAQFTRGTHVKTVAGDVGVVILNALHPADHSACQAMAPCSIVRARSSSS